MNKLFVIGFLLISSINIAPVYAKPASPESVRQLLNNSNSGEMGMQMIDQMLPMMKQIVPDAPEQFWQDFRAEVNADEMIEMVIPIYQKYLTEEDIQAINAFYNTPEGQKLIRVQPYIMQESMQAGQQWGEELSNRVIKKYQEEYGK